MAPNRISLADSDGDDLPQGKADITQIDDLETYESIQLHIKNIGQKIMPEESEEKPRQETDITKTEMLATLISEIAHKAGKGKTNQLLDHLLTPEFDLEVFSTRFQDADACHRFVDDYVVNSLHEEGFIEQKIDDFDTGLTYSIFARSPVTVIRRQINACDPGNCFFSPVREYRNGENCYSHPMTAPAGHNIYEAVKKAVMSSSNINVFWKSISIHGSESFVGVAQLYSDKSSVTLKARGFQFYPVHLVLLNQSEDLRRKMITSGCSIVGYLPVSFQVGDHAETDSHKTVRKQVILSLHEGMRKLLEPLNLCAEKGIECNDADGTPRTCHVALGAYCSDIPEAKDMTGVLHGSSTASTCFRCLAPTTNMKYITNARKRTLDGTLKLISESEQLREEARTSNTSTRKRKREEAESLLKESSLAGIAPALTAFPFLGLCSDLELFALYLYEPLHNLHLGISKLIKLACAGRLTDKELRTSAMAKNRSKTRSFVSARAAILSAANEILRQLEKEFPARGLRVAFGSAEKGRRYNGFFKSDGIVGMLEAKDFQALDMVFPFIGAYIDRCCGEVETSPTTRIFTMYSEILMMVYRRRMKPGWTEQDLKKLKEKIVRFKKEAVELYESYQASGMGTLKFHLLDHLVDDLRRMGGIHTLDAGLYEHSHARVKRWYNRTSKRRATAMSESMEILQRSQAYEKQVKERRRKREVSARVSLVRDGYSMSINELVQARRRTRQIRKEGTTNILPTEEKEMNLDQLVADIGEDGARVLTRLLKEKLDHGLHSKRIVQRVNSGFVAGGFVPDLTNFDRESGTTRLLDPPQFEEQRIVAARFFAGSDHLRQDCVIIEAQDDSADRVLWVAQVLALFRIIGKGNTSRQIEEESQFAFMQYFDIVAPRDEVDEELNCICMKWALAPEDDEDIESHEVDVARRPCKWFDLQPVNVIRGTVHVATTDYPLPKMKEKICWWDRFFYVNRFFYDPRAIKHE